MKAKSIQVADGSVRVQQGLTSVQLRPDEQAQVSVAGDMKVLRNVPGGGYRFLENGFFYFGSASFEKRLCGNWPGVRCRC